MLHDGRIDEMLHHRVMRGDLLHQTQCVSPVDTADCVPSRPKHFHDCDVIAHRVLHRTVGFEMRLDAGSPCKHDAKCDETGNRFLSRRHLPCTAATAALTSAAAFCTSVAALSTSMCPCDTIAAYFLWK